MLVELGTRPTLRSGKGMEGPTKDTSVDGDSLGDSAGIGRRKLRVHSSSHGQVGRPAISIHARHTMSKSSTGWLPVTNSDRATLNWNGFAVHKMAPEMLPEPTSPSIMHLKGQNRTMFARNK